ncbi:MAG TPA: hypothetical protein V6D05_17160 [Stenomitos sp.]
MKTAWGSLGITAIALSLGLVGCMQPVAVFQGMDRLDDKVVPAQAHSLLALLIRDQQPAGYQTAYLRVLDWDKAVATLDRVMEDAGNPGTYIPDPSFTAITKQGAAGMNTADAVRSVSLTMSSLTPGNGYRLRVDLIKTTPSGDKTIATGTNIGSGAGFTLNNGGNNVNVTLSMTSDGNAQVVVPDPGAFNTLTTSVSAYSSFGVQRVAGTTTTTLNAPQASATGTNLYQPAGIEVDASGSMYVADSLHHEILKIDSGSTVFAGTGTAGGTGDGGLATAAQLSQPRGLARIPSSGTLYVADYGNNRIRRISPDGNIYNFAGGGIVTAATASPATTAQLNGPTGLAIDSPGNVYFTEAGSGRVCRVDTNGDLKAIATGLSSPTALAIDRTNKILWVAADNTIRKITNIDAASPTLAGTAVYTGGTYDAIYGLTYDHNGLLYATTSYTYTNDRRHNNKVLRLPVDTTGSIQSGRSVETIAGRNFDTSVAPNGSVPTTTVANALTQEMAGAGFAGLYIDTSQSNSNSTVSGILYLSQWYYSNGYGQVLKFTPSTLN